MALAIVDHISSTSAIRWPVAKITRQDVVELPIFLIAALAKFPLPHTCRELKGLGVERVLVDAAHAPGQVISNSSAALPHNS